MKSILSIILFLVSISCFSQDYQNLVRKPLVPSSKADSVTTVILNAFTYGGEEQMDKVIDSMDSSWYVGFDVYITNDEDIIPEMMDKDTEASFKYPQVKKATVSVASNDFYTAVIIFSYKL